MSKDHRERKYDDQKITAAANELERYRKRQRYIVFRTEQLKELREKYSGIEAMTYDDVIVQGGEQTDILCEFASRLADLEAEIQAAQKEELCELWYVYARFESLSVMQSRVLEFYYIKGYSIAKIAEIIGYSERQIKRIKFEALKKFAYL